MSRRGQQWADVQPCGTIAACRRHLRHHEQPCYSCRQAYDRFKADRRGGEYQGPPDPRPARNGLPGFRPYVRGAHRPAWTLRAIEAAEAQHGPPVPTCLCGGRVVFNSHPGQGFGTVNGVCRECGAAGGAT